MHKYKQALNQNILCSFLTDAYKRNSNYYMYIILVYDYLYMCTLKLIYAKYIYVHIHRNSAVIELT